jgi:large subunit ribosomal protein L17
MRHRKTVAKLGKTAAHRRAMYRNMVTSLLREERVVTTVPKAKAARRVAERMITFAKRGDLHARRQAARVVRDHEVLQKLFEEIGPRFAERPGGYTRILKTGFRQGDNAPMSILELVGAAVPHEKHAEAAEEKASKPRASRKKKEGASGEAPKTRAKAKKAPAKKSSKAPAKKVAKTRKKG